MCYSVWQEASRSSEEISLCCSSSWQMYVWCIVYCAEAAGWENPSCCSGRTSGLMILTHSAHHQHRHIFTSVTLRVLQGVYNHRSKFPDKWDLQDLKQRTSSPFWAKWKHVGLALICKCRTSLLPISENLKMSYQSSEMHRRLISPNSVWSGQQREGTNRQTNEQTNKWSNSLTKEQRGKWRKNEQTNK